MDDAEESMNLQYSLSYAGFMEQVNVPEDTFLWYIIPGQPECILCDVKGYDTYLERVRTIGAGEVELRISNPEDDDPDA
jgi:hypothetical protein